MDILFSPYGFGGMPKSAMAEVERRTEELLRSSSFQRMLELEKKHKMDRLRGTQALLPSPQLSGPPPRPERLDAAFPQEQFLMVKASRRTVVLPPLTITIPPPADHEGLHRASKGRVEREDEEDDDVGTPTNTEPFQKQVKFLAPDDDGNVSEDGMSEQSSICQSPSWEGYGQRKKDKKREAERRKREKEQAEKEAKAAKKRASARLSKAPPPPPAAATASRESTGMSLTSAERSMSDPLLVTRRLGQSPQFSHRPQDAVRTTSADNLQHSRHHRPAVTEILSGSSSNNDISWRHDLRRSMSEGPDPLHQQSSAGSAFAHDSRSQGDGLPPSASRTSMLRHMSPSGRNRINNLYQQQSTEANHSQESLSNPFATDGGYRRGYVGHHRAQVTERALAGLVDEQVARSAAHYYPPSRSSSGQTQHSRRSSLTQDAKAAAMKFVGLKPSSTTKDDNNSQTDYLTFKAIPYTASGLDASPSMASMPASPRGVGERPSTSETVHLHNRKVPQESPPVLERSTTSQSSASLSELSVTESVRGSHGKKSRSFKDAAKAALNISKGSQGSTNTSKPSVSAPPYLSLRSRVHSRVSAHAENNSTTQKVEEAPSKHTEAVSTSDSVKPPQLQPQAGYRASEGSSSSSAYEDGSPLPSPSTTPDTSRPQSAKDVPLTTNGVSEGTLKTTELQDDERTLRQSLDSSKSSTPRGADGETRVDIEMGHADRWSRSALPIDIDFDAQSFMTTVSNFDEANVTDQVLSGGLLAAGAEKERREPLNGLAMTSPQAGDTEPTITIPPRSRKRGQTTPDQSTSSPVATAFSTERQEDQGTVQDPNGNPEYHVLATETRWPPSPRTARNYARPLDLTTGREDLEDAPERHAKNLQNQASRQQNRTPGSTSSNSPTVPSAGPRSPHALAPDRQVANRTYSADLTESPKYQGFSGEVTTSTGPPSPISLPSPLHQVPPKPPAQPRTNSAPTPLTASATTSRASTPSARASGIVPVSILKQPKNPSPDQSQTGAQTSARPPVLSALPKHMQLQAGGPARPPGTVAETRMAPLAKIFVECCNCKFYHDMPSKVYECMAKPDAVVEDRLLGISGNITTMVKCPWCQHNMSRNCCPGYAAVVYLKEKLH